MEKAEKPPTPDIREGSTESCVEIKYESSMPSTSEDIVPKLPKQLSCSKTAEWIKSSSVCFPNYFPIQEERLERFGELLRIDVQTQVKNYTETSATNMAKRSAIILWMLKAQALICGNSADLFQWVQFLDICLSSLKPHKPYDAEFICLSSSKHFTKKCFYMDLRIFATNQSFIPKTYSWTHLEKMEQLVDDFYGKYKDAPNVLQFLRFYAEQLELSEDTFTHCLFILECNMLNACLLDAKVAYKTSGTIYHVLSTEKSPLLEKFVDNSHYCRTDLQDMAAMLLDFMQNIKGYYFIVKYFTPKYKHIYKEYMPDSAAV